MSFKWVLGFALLSATLGCHLGRRGTSFRAGEAPSPHDLSGSWVLNVSQSPGVPTTDLSLIIHENGDTIEIVRLSRKDVSAMGGETYTMDGRDHSISANEEPDGQVLTNAVWNGNRLVITTRILFKGQPKLTLTDTYWKDGNVRLLHTRVGSGPGVAESYKWTFDKFNGPVRSLYPRLPPG